MLNDSKSPTSFHLNNTLGTIAPTFGRRTLAILATDNVVMYSNRTLGRLQMGGVPQRYNLFSSF